MHISVGGGTDRKFDPTNPSYDRELANVTFYWMYSLCTPLLNFHGEVKMGMDRQYHSYFTNGDWARAWSVRDSYGGVKSIGGSAHRLPGQYRPDPTDVDDDPNDADPKHVATDTNEFMHASVRVRWGDKNPATWPEALKGFVLRKGSVRRTGPLPDDMYSGWEWAKPLADGSGREVVIPEARFSEDESAMTVGSQMWNELIAGPK